MLSKHFLDRVINNVVITKRQFDNAVNRLLGRKYQALLDSGYNRPQFCNEVARDLLIQSLSAYPEQEQDVAIVREVAQRLWQGDGTTGLLDD